MSDKIKFEEIRLIAVDMDGTVLRPDSTVSSDTLLVLKKQVEAGIFIIPASGRIYGGIPEVIMNLGVPYVISANGASLIDVRTGDCIYESNIKHEAGIALLEKLLEENGYTYIQYKDQYYGDGSRIEEAMQLHSYLEDEGPSKERELDDLLGFLKKQGKEIQKVGLIAFDEETEKRVLGWKDKLVEFDIVSTGFRSIEFNKKGTSKKEALNHLCNILHIDRSQVMAIGDNGNDISMLEYAGVGVAMGNAPEVVKQAADFITRSNTEDGVAWAIQMAIN